ncbi:MAG: DUF4258 domain-containing protein [Candidatus Omnitrophica bacterium]|nr:DUF4258 domain-containing protein [Candidatus Omnitrophota bacterium]
MIHFDRENKSNGVRSITWLRHARDRLAERGIDEAIVLEALKKPDQVIHSAGQKIIHKAYRDSQSQKEYLLRIFVDEYAGTQVIRTVYRTSKISKYWRKKK